MTHVLYILRIADGDMTEHTIGYPDAESAQKAGEAQKAAFDADPNHAYAELRFKVLPLETATDEVPA